jgi:hypothetical protein
MWGDRGGIMPGFFPTQTHTHFKAALRRHKQIGWTFTAVEPLVEKGAQAITAKFAP